MRICIAANEDGFGPSALAFYLIQGLFAEWRKLGRTHKLQIVLLNKRAHKLNHALHDRNKRVQLVPLDSFIRLERQEGEVCVPATVRALRSYPAWQEQYCGAVRRHLVGCALSIDVGVPLLARAARRFGVPHVTVFDHSWARTLQGIVSQQVKSQQQVPRTADLILARRIAAAIEQDEKYADEVFLFDRYLTPPEFLQHWRKLGLVPRVINGVFGTRCGVDRARNNLNRILHQRDQCTVSTEKLVLITPGGTAVWAGMMERMIQDYIKRLNTDYLPVFAPYQPTAAQKRRLQKSANIRWFDFVPGGTLQEVLPTFEVVITKAGGGTVNDCLASRTPFVCVEERQWQVKLIERECKRLGIIPTLRQTSLDVFREDPVRSIDMFVAKYAGRRCSPVRTGRERSVAKAILQRFLGK
jgi:hypothetical protein